MAQKPVNSDLLRRVRAIQELKGQYYIGSQNAFKYLKAMKYYERICDEVCKELNINPKLSVREIAYFCRLTRFAVQWVLELVSMQKSTTEDFSICCYHLVDMPELDGIKYIYLWEIDHSMFIKEFLRDLLAKRERITIKNVNIESILVFLKGSGQNIPFFVFQKTGEKVSLRQFAEQSRFRRSTQEIFWGVIEGFILGDAISTEEEEDYQHFLELKKDFKLKDLKQCHLLFQKISINAKLYLSLEGEPSIQNTLEEEDKYLLCSKELFDRAEKEYTLGTFEVERKIALAEVYKRLSEEELNPVELVDQTIGDFLNMRDKAAKWTFWDRNSRQGFSYRKYTYLALRKNRPWLIEFFSR